MQNFKQNCKSKMGHNTAQMHVRVTGHGLDPYFIIQHTCAKFQINRFSSFLDETAAHKTFTKISK